MSKDKETDLIIVTHGHQRFAVRAKTWKSSLPEARGSRGTIWVYQELTDVVGTHYWSEVSEKNDVYNLAIALALLLFAEKEGD